MVERGADDALVIAGLEVRRDLEEDGGLSVRASSPRRAALERAFVLQRAQARRVRRADVDGQIAATGAQSPDARG